MQWLLNPCEVIETQYRWPGNHRLNNHYSHSEEMVIKATDKIIIFGIEGEDGNISRERN